MKCYDKHNEEVIKFLEDKRNGCAKRVEMTISANPRMILCDPQLNKEKISFQEYMDSIDKTIKVQAEFQEYMTDYMEYDHIMGFDNVDGIYVYPDYQNIFEAVYYGCEPAYHGVYEPGTKVLLANQNKYEILKGNFNDPIHGIQSEALEKYEKLKKVQTTGFTYKGKPIKNVGVPGLGTDGPFTIICCLLGATQACIDLYEDREYILELLDYITETTINRIKALRRYLGMSEITDSFSFADDSIALISLNQYEELILPFHKRLVNELSNNKKSNSIHLCGDASRFFPTIEKELNVSLFDTGFPINHKQLVKTLGKDTIVQGGVHVDILRGGTVQEVVAEGKRILEEVMPYTRNFVMKEANNLSPGTPPENIAALYETVKQLGIY